MRQLIIDKIRREYINGLKELPFWVLKLAGIRQNVDGTYVSLEQLDYLVANVSDEILLVILDWQACNKYR